MCSLSNFGRTANLGKVNQCSQFSAFLHNGSHSDSLKSQSLINGFVSLSRLIDVSPLVICSRVSLDCGVMGVFSPPQAFSQLHVVKQVLLK